MTFNDIPQHNNLHFWCWETSIYHTCIGFQPSTVQCTNHLFYTYYQPQCTVWSYLHLRTLRI